MSLIKLVKNLLNVQKKLDTRILPSQGLFYKDDFEIWIKRADVEDIIEYEYKYTKDNIGVIIHKVKKLAENNIILSYGYSFDDIKSIDIIFLFLEIVKFTKGEAIKLDYVDEDTGHDDVIEFGHNNFNYFEISNELMEYYDVENQQFIIDGYKYSLPSIGVENSLTNFLISKSDDVDAIKYNDYFYDFTYFLGDKNKLSFSEIDNLIQIFNCDIEPSELSKIIRIMKTFMPIQSYSLTKNGKIIEITSKIDLEKIWK
jgi:hypothetical protein